MKPEYDIAVIGSGFAGSLMAMIAERLGYSVLLIEKGSHPRFVIGESSTPLTNLMLEETAEKFDLPFLKSFSKWGTWQSEHPEIGCGLKRGFTFLKHELGSEFKFHEDHSNQLLVAASPNDRIADTHWYRPDFDQYLQQKAVELGVDYVDRCEVNAITWEKLSGAKNADYWGEPVTLNLLHQNNYHDVQVKLTIDASGPRGCLWKLLELDEMPLAHLPDTRCVFSHFRGVDELEWPEQGTPYPPEAAAAHHVFDGGWIWVLRFKNGITSAGVVARRDLAEEWNFKDGEAGWQNALDQLPSVKKLFATAETIEPFHYLPKVSFRSLQVSGPGWVMLPSAVGFADPLLSTGFPLTLRGVQRLGRILKEHPLNAGIAEPVARYSEVSVLELDVTASLIAALYWNMNDFPLFTALTKLYFAAVSYSEARRRLGTVEEDEKFLLIDRARFGQALRKCVQRATDHGQMSGGPKASESIQSEVLHAIEGIDVIGIGRSERQNWYPADNADLFASRGKLNASRADIENLIRRCGL